MEEVETGKVGMLWGWGLRFRGFGSRTMVEKSTKMFSQLIPRRGTDSLFLDNDSSGDDHS